jgi:diguanylate cyclase (GGDEF)-like protein/PAS domain S-box-containing protein
VTGPGWDGGGDAGAAVPKTGDRPGPTRRSAVDEFRLQALAEHVFDAVVVLGADGTVEHASESVGPLFGIPNDDIVGISVLGILDVEGATTIRNAFQEMIDHDLLTASLEFRSAGPDGGWVDIELIAANHLHDSIAGVVVHLRDVTESKRIEAKAREAERRHAAIIDSLVDGVMMVDREGVVVRVNQAFVSMFGAGTDLMVGRRLEEIHDVSRTIGLDTIHPDGSSVAAADHPLLMSLATGDRFTGVEHGIRRKGDDPVWIRINSQPIFDDTGREVTGAVASFSDITEARNATTFLRREERFLQAMLDNIEEGIVACDRDGRLTIFNQAAKRLHGLSERSDPTGKVPTDRGLRRADGTPMSAADNPLVRALGGEQLRDEEMILETRSGDRRTVTVNGQLLLDEAGERMGAVVAMHDVTEQKQNQDRLADLALHDPLTGLANRTLLGERMREAIERTRASASSRTPLADEGAVAPSLAVFLLDLDDFKEVNDRFGHDAGDDVLMAVGRRLVATVRPSDTVARLGGDEFVVICELERGAEEMEAVAERLSAALSEPYSVDGRIVLVGASVGGVLTEDLQTDPSKLLSKADDAMYDVKWGRRKQRRSMID